jgi:hypothetical protein
MAYADYSFYSGSFYGDALPEETAPKWLELASDELDAITFGRLTFSFPTIEAHALKVQKAVCAIAEALYYIDIQRKAAMAQQAADGSYRGAVTSVSSGRESISYGTGNAAASSIYAAAAADSTARQRLITDTAVRYLANVPDANGINLLYGGV